MTEVKQLKVLVSAHSFSPVRGSEYSVGWDYVRAIASRHKAWVITKSTQREEIEHYLNTHSESLPNVTVHYVYWKERSASFPEALTYLRYKHWQWRALRLARTLDAEIDFDLVHHVNGTGFREPGHLWKLRKPFVWGPIGGLQFFPLNLSNAVPFRSRLFFLLKNVSTFWAMHGSPGPRRAAAAAKAIIAGSGNVAEMVHALWGKHARVSCQVSAPNLTPQLPARRGREDPFRIVWSGTCDPRKALNVVLRALAQLKGSSINWQLVVIGDGRLLENWKALAEKLGLGERCSFLGRVARADVLSVLSSGHCFVLPSLYEGTPTVLAEALALGVPAICLDLFGMRDIVDAECGIKVPPNNLDQIVRDFADAIRALALDEDRRYNMAIAAQKAAQRLTWKQKETFINNLYNELMPQSSRDTGDARQENQEKLRPSQP